MKRRDFLKGLLLTAAGLAVPPLALEAPVRRLWVLDGTMLGGGAEIVTVETLADAEAFAAAAGRVLAFVNEGIAALELPTGFRAPAAYREYSYPFGNVQIEGRVIPVHDLRITMSELRGGLRSGGGDHQWRRQ